MFKRHILPAQVTRAGDFPHAPALPMWCITCGHPAIRQRFFIAVDQLDRTCLVDERGRALKFQLREEAERFAERHCAEHDWALTRA